MYVHYWHLCNKCICESSKLTTSKVSRFPTRLITFISDIYHILIRRLFSTQIWVRGTRHEFWTCHINCSFSSESSVLHCEPWHHTSIHTTTAHTISGSQLVVVQLCVFQLWYSLVSGHRSLYSAAHRLADSSLNSTTDIRTCRAFSRIELSSTNNFPSCIHDVSTDSAQHTFSGYTSHNCVDLLDSHSISTFSLCLKGAI